MFVEGWGILCENIFVYVKFDYVLGVILNLSLLFYYYKNLGCGDWILFYLMLLVDGDGNLIIIGGENVGSYGFIDSDGNLFVFVVGCMVSLEWLWLFGLGLNLVCYLDDVILVMLYCYIYYKKDCLGMIGEY